VAEQKPLSELAVEIPLGRTLVPEPLAPDSIGVGASESLECWRGRPAMGSGLSPGGGASHEPAGGPGAR